MSIVIKIENVSKQYRLGLIGIASLLEDGTRFYPELTGKENIFLNGREEFHQKFIQ